MRTLMLDFGLTTEAFLQQHFERGPWLRRGALQSATHLQSVFSWRDLDELLHHIEPTDAGLQLFRNGLVAQTQYTSESTAMGLRRRRLHKRRFWAQLHAGATLVLNRLEHQSSAMQRLCSDVARFCTLPTSGNAYLSIGGDGSFGRHWDTHDVFAVQLIGSKRWRVFEPTQPLPLADQTSQRSPAPCPSQPLLDVTLQAGDLLYLPRGWWHEVLPGDQPSFHFSIGSYAPTVQDYLVWASQQLLPGVIDARRSFLPGADMQDVASALQRLQLQATRPEWRARFHAERWEKENGTVDFDTALFLSRNAATSLPPSTRIALVARVQSDGDRVELIGNGSKLSIDGIVRAIVMLVWHRGTCTLRELGEQLPHTPDETLRSVLLELATHELVSLDRS